MEAFNKAFDDYQKKLKDVADIDTQTNIEFSAEDLIDFN